MTGRAGTGMPIKVLAYAGAWIYHPQDIAAAAVDTIRVAARPVPRSLGGPEAYRQDRVFDVDG
jgi:hypothetical protein